MRLEVEVLRGQTAEQAAKVREGGEREAEVNAPHHTAPSPAHMPGAARS